MYGCEDADETHDIVPLVRFIRWSSNADREKSETFDSIFVVDVEALFYSTTALSMNTVNSGVTVQSIRRKPQPVLVG